MQPPQMTKVQAAPCHRPPSSIVSIRLTYVRARAAAVAAERDVEVVAQPRESEMCQRRQNSVTLRDR